MRCQQNMKNFMTGSLPEPVILRGGGWVGRGRQCESCCQRHVFCSVRCHQCHWTHNIPAVYAKKNSLNRYFSLHIVTEFTSLWSEQNISVISWEFFELITLAQVSGKEGYLFRLWYVWIWRGSFNKRAQTCDLTTILSTWITEFFFCNLHLNLILEP
jgi:hypothetical protein